MQETAHRADGATRARSDQTRPRDTPKPFPGKALLSNRRRETDPPVSGAPGAVLGVSYPVNTPVTHGGCC